MFLSETELRQLIAAIQEASSLCVSVQRSITSDVLEKRDKSPVTVADFGSQALILRRIRELFPDDLIVAEEGSADLHKDENSGLRDRLMEEIQAILPDASFDQVAQWIDFGDNRTISDRFWTLDPIDGTKGFLRGGQYAISLALILHGEIVFGILALPNFAEVDPTLGEDGALFIASRQGGAYRQPLPGGDRQTIRVSGKADFRDARFCESVESGHSDHLWSSLVARRLDIRSGAIRMDSQAKYGALSCGLADIYLRLPTRAGYREMIWDHAAGVLVVEEAGGKVSDIDGKPLDFSKGYRLEENRGVVVTCGPFHDEVIAAVLESESETAH